MPLEQESTLKMQRIGFLSLPGWHVTLKSWLSEMKQEDLLFAPVLNAEDSEPHWKSLEAEDFFASVDIGIAFSNSHSIKRIPSKIVTSDCEIAIKLISENLKRALSIQTSETPARFASSQRSDSSRKSETSQRSESAQFQIGYRASLGGINPIFDIISNTDVSSIPVKILTNCDGVANSLLLEMENRALSLDESLREIQWRGLVSKNPVKSIHGITAREKLSLLTLHFFGILPSAEDIPTEGLTHLLQDDILLAKRLDASIRLAGKLEFEAGKLRIRVKPFLFPNSHPMAGKGYNAEGIMVSCKDKSDYLFIGQGNENWITLSAIIKDIEAIKNESLQNSVFSKEEIKFSFVGNEAKFYLRFSLENFTSTLSQLVLVFSQNGIEIERIMQTRNFPEVYKEEKNGEQIIILTAKVDEISIKNTLKSVNQEIKLATLLACHEIEGSLNQK
ncbi:MAG: hypothetical protein HQM08_05690 [Candidatus Riflebacteria bacterium]|nr:hypothetical protein [Candidatus Riflebacteria bacterium]